MKFRFLGVCAIAVVLGFSMAGCAKNSIVGKWSGNIPLPGGRGSANANIEYKPDGTETIVAQIGPLTVNETATYTVKDNTVTTTATGATMSGRSMTLPPQALQPQTTTFSIDGDTLKLTNAQSSQTVTLTRVKS